MLTALLLNQEQDKATAFTASVHRCARRLQGRLLFVHGASLGRHTRSGSQRSQAADKTHS